MTVIRRVLETILGELKERSTFRLGGKNLNREHDAVDVFPAIEDAELAAFSPTDEGTAASFLLWTRSAESAFDRRGVLTRSLPMTWGGQRNPIQMAFARHGLTVRIEADEPAREGYFESGRLVLSPRADAISCDLRRLLEAFASLEQQGVIALANAGSTRSAGWEDVDERAQDSDQPAVFWHDQSHEAFDGLGQLASPLHLYWRGDAARIGGVLSRAGFTVVLPESSDTAICIEPSAGPAPSIETFEEASRAAVEAAPAPRKRSRAGEKTGKAPAAAAGPLSVLHRFRSPDRKPVQRIGFDRAAGSTLYVAQMRDRRGWPDRVLCVVDVETGVVRRALTPQSSSVASCGGCDFLPDGRLVFSFYDFVSGGRSGVSSSIVALKSWEPEGDVERDLGSSTLSHISDVGLSAVDARGELVAVVTPGGVSVRAVGSAGVETPWREVSLVGGPPLDTYPVAAMSADTRYVGWSESGGKQARCIERATGRVLWTTDFFPGHQGGRGLDALCFDPAGAHLIALCTRSLYGPTVNGRVDVQEDRRLQIYAVPDGRRVHKAIEQQSAGLTALGFHPSGTSLAIGTEGGELVILAYPGGERLAALPVFPKGRVTALAFHHEGGRIAVGGEKGEIMILAYRGAEPARVAD